jgi:glycogen debranching enzyme
VIEREPELQPAIGDDDWFALPEGEPMGIEDIRDALVIRERGTFLLTDEAGNVPPGNRKGYGIYHADTRHLSAWSFKVNGHNPVLLLSTAELGYAMEQVSTNPTFESHEGRTVQRGSIEIRRQRLIADVVEERLQVTNFNPFPVTLSLMYELSADFADIFDVRGYERERLGTMHPPQLTDRTIDYRYTGIDERERRTHVAFDAKPDYLDESTALFRVTLRPRERAALLTTIMIDRHGTEMPAVHRFETVASAHRRWIEGCTEITTDNEFFNRVIARSLSDVRMLWTELPAHDGGYPAAGTPWFDALFGRDSCILSMQMLAYRPELARRTLELLARWQGTKVDPQHDEEPGKMLHELRLDELSRAGELPYGPYYGSIDSTPLFLMLVVEYWRWTADVRFIRTLLPAIRAALAWMDTYGDPAGSGYLTYEKHSAKGLVNQGWKDSWDAVPQANGQLAKAPIALAEVQGYAFAARCGLPAVLDRLNEPKLAEECRVAAERLRRRFHDDFWVAAEHSYAMALDGDGLPVASVASNPAHCLWAGLLDPPHSDELVQRLMAPDMFSGWGIRTLSAKHPRFNPIGYHIGTVWPHDNSIAAMGFKMYGFEEELNRLASALFDAAVSFPYFRLPELFGGEARSAHNSPVPYPVACRPQSWAAGAMPFITQAILGLKPEAPERRLRIVNPKLPPWLNTVHVRGLRVGGGTVSLQYRRTGRTTHVEVQKVSGGVDVIVSNKRWPAA